MDKPELIIPVKLDPSEALTMLRKLGAEGKQAGKDGEDGAKGFQGAIAGLIQTALGFGAIKSLVGQMGAELARSADYVRSVTKEFIDLQKSMQGVASLAGKLNTAQFAHEEIRGAERANVTPQEYREFRDAFLARASLYVGAGKEAKLSEADAQEFQRSLAEFAKQKGVSQHEMAGFAGGLLAQQKGPTTAAAMKARAGKVFATLEASSADVSHLLPMMTRVMAQGFQAEEAAPTLAMMPEIAPEEEGTYVLRAVAAVREAAMAGKGGYGIQKGASSYQNLRNVVAAIRKRAAGGEDLDTLLKGVAPEHISQQALRGMVGQGEEGFDRWMDLVRKTPGNQLDETIRQGRETGIGRRYAAESQLAASRAREGAANAAAELELVRGEASATASGEVSRPGGLVEDLARKAWQLRTGVSPEQQRINEEALQAVRLRARGAGVDWRNGRSNFALNTYGDEERYGGVPVADVRSMSQNAVNAEIKDLLRKIEANTGRGAAGAPAPPLSAPPPRPSGRQGG